VRIRYLLDENLDPRFLRTLQQHYPQIDVLRVGDAGAPGLGVSDPAILVYAEVNRLVLVTDNRKSMPGHVEAHWRAGRHHWGIFIVAKNAAYKRLADALFVYWDASELEEWMDQTEWVVV
jgi:hypothetical protein